MALTLNYKGNVLKDIIGRVGGPDVGNAWYAAVTGVYDPDTDTTHTQWRNVSHDEDVYYDDFGQVWLVKPEGTESARGSRTEGSALNADEAPGL